MKTFVYNAGALYSWLTNGARQMLATRFEASLSVCCCWHELHQLNSSRQINLVLVGYLFHVIQSRTVQLD